MTLDELLAREAIRHTLACYNMAGDRARVDDFVAVFTEDAELEIVSRKPGATQVIRGREAIRAWLAGFGGGDAGSPARERPQFVRHHLTTCQIDLTGPDTARARTYFHVYTQIGPDHAGHYADEFRRVGDRWLIFRRSARTDWHSPGSLMAADE